MKTITTRRTDFHRGTRDLGSELLEVKDGISADLALEHASNILESLEGLALDCSEDGLSPNVTYAMRTLVIQVNGLVDSVWNAIELGPENGESVQ